MTIFFTVAQANNLVPGINSYDLHNGRETGKELLVGSCLTIWNLLAKVSMVKGLDEAVSSHRCRFLTLSPIPKPSPLGRQTRPSFVLSRSDEADRRSYRAATSVAEKECCVVPQGLPGTAVPGPACQACPARASERRRMVWEAGGETLPPTRFGGITVCLEVYSAPPPLAPALINSAARNKNQLRRRSGRSR